MFSSKSPGKDEYQDREDREAGLMRIIPEGERASLMSSRKSPAVYYWAAGQRLLKWDELFRKRRRRPPALAPPPAPASSVLAACTLGRVRTLRARIATCKLRPDGGLSRSHVCASADASMPPASGRTYRRSNAGGRSRPCGLVVARLAQSRISLNSFSRPHKGLQISPVVTSSTGR